VILVVYGSPSGSIDVGKLYVVDLPNKATIAVLGITPVTKGGELVTFKTKDELEKSP
jgi:hypothetical protein